MVNKSGLIVKSNLKKSYKQLIAVVILLILSSLLLNVIFVLKLDYDNSFKNDCDRLNANDFRLAYINLTNNDYYDSISKTLNEDNRIKDFEIDEVYMGDGDADFSESSLSSLIVFNKYSSIKNTRIDKYEIIDEDKSINNGVYVSYIFKTTGLEIGDSCKVSIGNDIFIFNIKGFYNNPVIGTINCGGIAYILDDELYENVLKDKTTSYLVKVKCNDTNEITNVFNNTLDNLNSLNPGAFVSHSAFAEEIGGSRYTNANIFQVVLIISTITMSIILLSIIAIVMSNYVKENIKTLGTLKSIGYTSKMLIKPLIFEIFIICFISSIIGVFLSYLILPIINSALESQIGIPYKILFLLKPCLLSIIVCEIVSVLSTYFSISKIKRISSINAIRDSKEKANSVPNVLKLDKTNLNVNYVIGLNNSFQSLSHSIVIFLTFVGVSFLLCFSLFIYQNIIIDNSGIVDVICGEIPNYIVSIDNDNKEELINYLNNNEYVDNHYLLNMKDVSPVDKPVINFYAVEENSFVSSLDYIIVEGRFPLNEDEISVNKEYAIKNNVNLNDKLRFVNNNQEYELKVVAFNQGAARNATEGYILDKALSKITNSSSQMHYIFLDDIENEEKFKTSIMNNCEILYLNNNRQNVSSIVNMYMLILEVLAIILCVISILIICFILYVLISLLLENKRKEHGILKSIGFTTKDIIIQTEMSILPFSSLGSFLGLVISKDLVGKIISFALNSIGIFRFGESLKVSYLIIIWLFLFIIALLFVLLSCKPLYKIETHKLFNKE